ncbi:hypothetical protein M8J75_000712 [Diaphorina citri]|nr:hypothetical protein M8J75_000712 [Diaphorina citri]
MKPKISEDSLIKRHASETTGLALLCPAQAYPVPFFRTGWLDETPNPTREFFRAEIFVREKTARALLPRTSVPRAFLQVKYDGVKAFSKGQQRTIFKEPVGALKPKLATALNTIQGFNVKSSESLALLCPAQAYPVPFFRTGWSYEASNFRQGFSNP